MTDATPETGTDPRQPMPLHAIDGSVWGEAADFMVGDRHNAVRALEFVKHRAVELADADTELGGESGWDYLRHLQSQEASQE